MIGSQLPHATTPHGSVSVVVEGGEKTNPMGNPLISNTEFASAVTESLRNTGLFRSIADSGEAAFSLVTTLEDLSQPEAGISMTVDLQADWRLIRMSDKQVVWHEKIHSTHTARPRDAFVALKRIRLATEGAARENIEQALERLAAVSF